MRETIDNYIVDLIKTCNRLGFKTDGSCSAMDCDHKGIHDKAQDWDRAYGYIRFRLSKKKAQSIERIAKQLGFRIDYSFCIIPFKFYLHIRQPFFGLGLDDIKGKLWDDLFQSILS